MSLVVKLGGEVVGNREVAADLHAVIAGGMRAAIVHGGGAQATALQQQLGIATEQVAGRRITSAATLDVMKMALGRVNIDLCAVLTAAGIAAVGVTGAIRAQRQPPTVYPSAGPDPVDLGLVGEVIGFNTHLLDALWIAGFTPVLACLGNGDDGAIYNINGDTVANQLAVALAADHLVLVTSTPGVLRDVKDPTSRLPKLTRAEARQAIADGVVTGGMVAKLEEAIAVVDKGVGAIHIVGAAENLARILKEPGSLGTTIVA
ncbi:MAG: acetylglutamate kinase [Kofleriaceae bacterium]